MITQYEHTVMVQFHQKFRYSNAELLPSLTSLTYKNVNGMMGTSLSRTRDSLYKLHCDKSFTHKYNISIVCKVSDFYKTWHSLLTIGNIWYSCAKVTGLAFDVGLWLWLQLHYYTIKHSQTSSKTQVWSLIAVIVAWRSFEHILMSLLGSQWGIQVYWRRRIVYIVPGTKERVGSGKN